MKTIIDNTQNRLITIDGLNYVDEDWGQLDYYSPNFPVQWPCALIDVTNAGFDNTGKDRRQDPQQRQMAEAYVTITIADIKITNTSGRAPIAQKDNGRSIWLLIDEIHKRLQGWNPDTMAGKYIRRSFQRVKRDDGVREYSVSYSLEITDV